MSIRDLEFRDSNGVDVVVLALEDLPKRYQSRLVDVSNRRLKAVLAGQANYFQVRVRSENLLEEDKTPGLIGMRFKHPLVDLTAAYPFTFDHYERGFTELSDGDYVASGSLFVRKFFDEDEVLVGNNVYRKFPALLLMEVPGVFVYHVIPSDEHLAHIFRSDQV